MPDGEKIASAYVEITADQTPFDDAMARLPAKAAAKIDAVAKAIKAKMAAIDVRMGSAADRGDSGAYAALADQHALLGQRLKAVEMAAVRKAAAVRNDTAAAKENATAVAGQGAAAQKAAATHVTFAAGAAAAGKGGYSMGYGVLFAAQAIEDLQYGFSAVVNNIPLLVMGFGGSAGLAGAASLAAVAAATLSRHYDDLLGLFGTGKVESEAAQLEKLRQKLSLTADEAERLYRAEQLKGKTGELRAAKTIAERGTEEAVTAAIVNAGQKNVAQGVRKNAPELLEGTGGVPKAKRELENLRKFLTNVTESENSSDADMKAAKAAVVEAEMAYANALDKAAEEVAATGALPQLFPGGLKQLADMVRKNPGDFGPGAGDLLKGLDKASPEARRNKALEDLWRGFKDSARKQIEGAEVGNAAEREAETKAQKEAKARKKDEQAEELAKQLMPTVGREALALHLDENAIQAKVLKVMERTNFQAAGEDKEGVAKRTAKIVGGENEKQVRDRMTVTGEDRKTAEQTIFRQRLNEQRDQRMADAERTAGGKPQRFGSTGDFLAAHQMKTIEQKAAMMGETKTVKAIDQVGETLKRIEANTRGGAAARFGKKR